MGLLLLKVAVWEAALPSSRARREFGSSSLTCISHPFHYPFTDVSKLKHLLVTSSTLFSHCLGLDEYL